MATSAFDNRLVTVGISTPDGQTHTFNQDYYIKASGSKLGSPLLSTGEFRIDNINLQFRNYLLSVCSPFSGQYITNPASFKGYPLVTLDVGRASFGTFRLFQGYCIATAPTQPPDIGLTLKTLQGALLLGQPLTPSFTSSQNTKLSSLAQQVATALSNALGQSITLEFTADDIMVNNFSVTGSVYRLIDKLAECGNVHVFLEDNILVVINNGQPRNGQTQLINSQTGMVTVPVVNERGLQCRTLINSDLKLFVPIQVQSQINPAANGTWYPYILNFDISTWEQPFYWNIYAKYTNLAANTTP